MPVVAVLGANRDAIRATVRFENAIVVVNENWQQGLSTSIHAGLRAVESTAENIAGIILMTCDQPRLNADHLRSLIKAFESQSAPAIIASEYAGVHGTPAVFPHGALPRLFALRGDRGARALFVNPPCPVIALPFIGGEVDIDLPTDLSQLE